MFFRCISLFSLPIGAILLGGCASGGNSDLTRGIAASIVAGRAFDRASLAIKRDDNAALERAGTQINRAAQAGANPQLAGVLVRQLEAEATYFSLLSRQISGSERYNLEEKSNSRYRAALALAPRNAPEKILNASSLNALGYFLAEKGSTREDFERAAALTLAAYKSWDISGQTRGGDPLGRAIGAQDSYSWALFRLGKYQEARVQSEKVWDLARGMGNKDVSADIPFHLAEIYRVLGLEKEARETYKAALELDPAPEVRVLVERGLNLLDLATV